MTGPVEFVNREVAEERAFEAVRLLQASDSAKVEAWFAMQAVADQVGPASNVGVRGISWCDGVYHHNLTCARGLAVAKSAGPTTLEEARSSPWLPRAIAILEKEVEAKGGRPPHQIRHRGTGNALLAAVMASPTGAKWAEGRSDATGRLRKMVRVADVYGRDGVCPVASLNAHLAFLSFNDRASLVRQFPDTNAARMKAASLTHPGAESGSNQTKPSSSHVSTLALRSGVTRAEARALLLALMNGQIKTRLIRAVNEAARMVEQMEARDAKRAA